MGNSTIQQESIDWLQSLDPATETSSGVELKHATINAHTGPGRDWVAVIGLGQLYGLPLDPPKFWQIYRQKARGHETSSLAPTLFIVRRLAANISACTLMRRARSTTSPRRLLNGSWIGGSATL
jgi:hypothetical protein